MTLQSSLDNGDYLNIVIQIGDDYFADKTPDTDTESLINRTVGLIGEVDLPSETVDILDGDISIQTASFELADIDGYISDWWCKKNNANFGKSVKVVFWLGVKSKDITVLYNFPGSYQKIEIGYIRSATKDGPVWTFETESMLKDVAKKCFFQSTKLKVECDSDDTTLQVFDTSDFPSSGYIKIDDEYLSYTGKTSQTFTGVSRSALYSTADAHIRYSDVKIVEEITGNVALSALALLQSAGSGGTYDTLADGAALTNDYVDITAFTDIAASFDDNYITAYVSEIDSLLDYISQELLMPYMLRLVFKNGKVSIVAIDVVDVTRQEITLDEDTIEGVPSLTINQDEIVNVINVRFDYTVGNDVFSNEKTYTNQDSIDVYGEREPKEFEFSSQFVNGTNLFARFANKIFSRYSVPIATIEATANAHALLCCPGDEIRLIHENLPQPGVGLGHDAIMELLEITKSRDGSASLKLVYASYSGYRIGFICPSPLITGYSDIFPTYQLCANDAKSCLLFRPGYKCRLWNDSTSSYVNTTKYTVSDPEPESGKVSFVESGDFTGYRIKFADYDDCTEEQKRLFAFVGINSSNFADGLGPYQIVP